MDFSTQPRYTAAMKASMLLLALAATAIPCHATTRESFDHAWKFARFGPMPDGSQRDEPGTPPQTIKATSAEPANPPAHAIDRDPQTRWCAASGSPNEAITLDLGRAGQLSGIEIDWEKQASYSFKAEISTDGSAWKAAADGSASTNTSGRELIRTNDTARYIRITVLKPALAQWASIRELRALDARGNPVTPLPPGPAASPSPASPDFDDASWRTLNLPHDWGIEGPFRMDLENETGKLPWPGIGWYRKTLELTAADAGKRIWLDFDGAMSHTTVFVNGHEAGTWPYGYNSFRIELTPHLHPDKPNTLAVRLNNPPGSSRWYPGGGIYRHLWLVKSPPSHITPHGVFAHTTRLNPDQAELTVTTETTGPADGLEISHELYDPSGTRVAAARPASGATRLTVPKPLPWSVESPHLYTLRTSLMKGSETIDALETPVGIRTAEWKPDGFYLNGTRVQLKGVCNHHDLGALGAAFNTRAAERQLQLLKDMGCNSVRTSHNPPAPQLLDLCDRLGILVLDELFDMWKLAKKPNDYHLHFDAWHERDVAAFIRRDRNHPCVIAWSTGNEVAEQGRKDGFAISQNLTDLVRRHDPTRKVTVGMNNLNSALTGFGDTVDIIGFNYPVKDRNIAAKVRARRPNTPAMTTESASCVSTRGCYFFPASWDKSSGAYDFQVSSYELSAPPWANRPDLDFEFLERNPFLAGEYVWTGFDYIGEPTPYNQDSTNALNFQNEEDRRKGMEQLRKLGNRAPSRSSYFGILDLCGFPKDRYYLYQAHWRPDHPMAHILPHWNWPERQGQVTPVHVFTSGDEAELFLNGKSLGRKRKEPFQYRLVWEDVVYQPGTLTIKAWKQGKPWAEAERSTTGAASRVLATADRPEIRADGDDLCYVTLTIADDAGRLVPRSMHRLHFKIDGAATIEAACNGDPTSHEPMKSANTLPAFNGLCQVILRSHKAPPGKATLTVTADGLPATTLEITTR